MLNGSLWAAGATFASPGLRLLLRYRATRGKEIYARLAERRGIDRTRRPEGHLVWLHAASVGEILSILPVVTAMTAYEPDLSLLLTTGTVTSANLLAQRLPSLELAAQVEHRFAPFDVPSWVKRFLDHWKPDVAGFVESELWPNTLAECHARSIPTVLVNARMSTRSYTAWSRVPSAAREVLGGFVHILARSEEDAGRLRALGAKQVEVAGDLKLAASILPADSAVQLEMARGLAGRPIFLAASTHRGEEPLIGIVHEVLRAQHPRLLTIIAPRHPERGPEIAKALRAPRRAAGHPPPDEGLWIADTLGELGLWFQLSQVVFIGRSFISPGGGQNPLEPARFARAIATGPYTQNFSDHVTLLRDAGAVKVVADAHELARFVGATLADPIARRRMGEKAKMAIKASERMADDIARALLRLIKHV
jgi:3-deoxy-D-manno-octulosonic-acid transferase